MSPIFASLLVILFTTGQTSAHLLGFTVVDTIISWGSTIIFTKDALTDDTGENIEKILKKVDKISNDLRQFEIEMDIKLDVMLNTLLNDIKLTAELQDLKTGLLNNLNRVDGFHDDSLKYSPGKSYANSTLQGFANTVLFDADSLSRILVRMHNTFSPGSHSHLSPGFLSLIIKKSQQNLPTDCQRSITRHQLMYYIYVQLITAEMKGLATLKKVYTLKMWLENSRFDYKTELNEAHRNFETGVREYHQLFTKELARLPRHLRRCHVHPPTRGVDFLELERLSRVKLFKVDNSEQHSCGCCTRPKASYMENGIEMAVQNCKSISYRVTACPAPNSQSNDFSWWRDDESTYGEVQTCSQPEDLYAGAISPSFMGFGGIPYAVSCNHWYCTLVEKKREIDDPHSWRINSRLQLADIWNDKVVTGVRFIVKDKTIYLQIQQGKFSNNALVYSDIAWKDVDTHDYAIYKSETDYSDERICDNEKTIYLDDITVPKDSVVTGVQLIKVNSQSAFRLEVMATEFDFITGKLNTSRTLTYSQSNVNKTQFADYARDRIEINMGEADNPTRGFGFDYDPESNKKITFTHTDAHKDAGQTVIPFIDLQPVQVQPAFPLSGVGLYYRGKKGFGGYIAPRIYTLDITERMTIPKST